VEIIAAVQLGNEEVSMEQDLIGWQQFSDFRKFPVVDLVWSES
jgi:hypothetical protein